MSHSDYVKRIQKDAKEGVKTKYYDELKYISLELPLVNNERKCFGYSKEEGSSLLFVPNLDKSEHYHIKFTKDDIELVKEWIKEIEKSY